MLKILLIPMILAFTITLFSYGEDNKATLDVNKELANYRENCSKIKSFLENEDSWKDAYFHLNKKKPRKLSRI